MTAAERLTRRLVDLATEGRRPRCGEAGSHGLWLSDDAADRAQAATWCVGCRVLAECGAAADEQGEKFGVFGGTDRTTVTPTRPKPGLMPRRNHGGRTRTRQPFEPPPQPPPTPPQLAQRLVSRGLAHPVILELCEVYAPSRRHPDGPSS